MSSISGKGGLRGRQGDGTMTQMLNEPVDMEEQGSGSAGVRHLLVSSPKGGTGKTTDSQNIAVLAAQDGLLVAVGDFDPQQSLEHW
jgi:Mrp family chromosome partitioning ATPase